MSKKNLRTIRKFANYGAAAFIFSYIANGSARDAVDFVRYRKNVGFQDAVNVILKSKMNPIDKHEVVKELIVDGDSDFYKKVISIIKSNVDSEHKLNIITRMCRDWRDSK